MQTYHINAGLFFLTSNVHKFSFYRSIKLISVTCAFSFDILSLSTTRYFIIIIVFLFLKTKEMFKAIEPIINLVKVEHFTTSDFYFTLNAKFTPILLLFCTVLLTTMDVLRTSIDCYTDMTGNGRKAIMDNFCWSVGTYTCKNQTSSK